MLEYEKKLNFDKHYAKLQSNKFLSGAIGMFGGIVGYICLYFFIKYLLAFTSEFQPWDNDTVWFSVDVIKFIKVDLAYFICGLIITCFGTVRLLKITKQNRIAKNGNCEKPNKLLVDGYYGKVRHPMYAAFIILQAGFMLSLRSFTGIIIALVIIIFQYGNAFFEEKKQLIPIFGEQYYLYINNVKRMVLTRIEMILCLFVLLLSSVGFLF